MEEDDGRALFTELILKPAYNSNFINDIVYLFDFML